MSDALATAERAICAVIAERGRQDAKWGEQNRNPVEWISILSEEVGEAAKEANAVHFQAGTMGAVVARKGLRAELVQVAAVAVAAIECLDRNEAAEVPEAFR